MKNHKVRFYNYEQNEWQIRNDPKRDCILNKLAGTAIMLAAVFTCFAGFILSPEIRYACMAEEGYGRELNLICKFYLGV